MDFNSHTDQAVAIAVNVVNALTPGEERGKPYAPPEGAELAELIRTTLGTKGQVGPDDAAELALVGELRQRSAAALRGWVDREARSLTQLRSRPVLAEPLRLLDQRHDEVERLRTGTRRAVEQLLDTESTATRHLRDKLTAVGPAATMARGYAVVQRVSGQERHVVRTVADAPPGSQLRIRVADGALSAATLGSEELGAAPGTKGSGQKEGNDDRQ